MRYKAGIETRDRILEAVRSLIAERGLEGTTIKAICHRASVLPGSFYNLFDSKEQAILSVVRQAIEAVDPDPDRRGTDTLAELVEAYVRFITEQSDLARVYIAIAVSGSHNKPELRGRMMRHHENRVARFASALGRENPHLEPEECQRRAESLVVSLNGLALHRSLDPTFDVTYHSRRLMETVGAPT